MSAGEVVVYGLPIGVSDRRAPGWWGMILLITTEATLFASLLGSYFYLLSGSVAWPPDGIENPRLLWPIIASILLIGSSIPMYLADRSIRDGRQVALRIYLLIAFVLAALFIAIQIREYDREKFSYGTDTYSSLFFTITGLHGAHVISALCMNLFVQVRAWLGHFNERRRLAVTNVGWYWHFVDAVWVFIFVSLYLSPRWLP
jgi:heme/copper-type cytochrome/quinol oxidase subunit 3